MFHILSSQQNLVLGHGVKQGKYFRYSHSDRKESLRKHFASDRSFGFVSEDFRCKAVFFDMDSTLVEEETIVELSKATGKEEYVEKITKACMRGEMDFAEGLKQRVACLKGAPIDVFSQVKNAMRLTPGVRELILYLRGRGIPFYLVSGGFMEVAEPIAESLGFHGVLANRLEALHGKLTGKLCGEVVDAQRKKEKLLDVIYEMDISASEVMAIGDGANDIPMLEASGLAVGFRPKPKLYDYLDVCNGSGDHRFVIDLLEMASL